VEEQHLGPIWFIPGENQGKYPFCHSIYIDGAGILIDPGSNRERLVQLRESRGVKQVWLSHWHEDHFRNLDLFDSLPLWCSERTAPILADLELFMDAYGVEDESRDYWRSYFIEQFHFKPRKATRRLKEGEMISLNTVTVEVIGTPGHTCGHLAFFFREPQVLFMGDYDLSNFGPWYADVYSSIEETMTSIGQLRNIPAQVWLTSHETGVFQDDPGRMWEKYLGVIVERERRLMSLIEEPKTLDDIVDAWIVYRKPLKPDAGIKFLEGAHMKKHLQRLINQGMVGMKGDRYQQLAS